MWETTGMNKRIIQIFLLVILGAGALIVIFIVARMFVAPPDYLPPTINPLVPTVNISVTVTEERKVIVSGTTNLPDESLLAINLIEENGNYREQLQVSVIAGSYQSGQFGGAGSLNFGSYRVEVWTRKASEQPESVRVRYGPNGVNLVGEYVIQEAGESYAKAVARFEVLIPPPVLRGVAGPGIGQLKKDLTSGFDLTLQAAYKTDKAYGIEPPRSTSAEYANEFVFVELLFTNIDNKARFISYDRFVLFLNEEFAFTDINIPYTRYPDSRFTVNETAKADGFFGIQEVQPGESFTGRIAFVVPNNVRRFVLSTNASGCDEQNGTLLCFPEYPSFEIQN